MIWVAFALLTGVAVFGVLWPLARRPRSVAAREADVAFYKAQIAEIARDTERGLIAPADAPLAEAEAARRLLTATEKTGPVVDGSRRNVRLAAVAMIIFIPAVTLGLYAKLGSPELPDEPLQARLTAAPDAAHFDINAALARIEANIVQHPDDPAGYQVIAPVYMQLGRAADAAAAYANLIRISGPTADNETGYGEALFFGSDGKMTADAEAAFTKAASLAQTAPKPRFYLAIAAEQRGDKAGALDILNKLLASAPPGADWADAVRAHIATLQGNAPASVAAGSAPAMQAPAAAGDAAAIAAMSPADRDKAIRGMVDGLAARLAQNGADIDGWLRLVRAYSVLHEDDKAKAALADARQKLDGNTDAMAKLQELAHELGLDG